MRRVFHLLLSASVIALVALPTHARANVEGVKLALIRPGGGFLVADGQSIIPLEILVSRETQSQPLQATVVARAGKAMNTRILEGGGVFFHYLTPKKTASETLEVTLAFADGNYSESFTFVIPAPNPPKVDLFVTPGILTMTRRGDDQRISINAAASGSDVFDLEVLAQPGTTVGTKSSHEPDTIRLSSTVSAQSLPRNEPSCVLTLAAASSARGFSAKSGATVIEASLTIDVDIPPKSELIIEGAANNPPPTPAPSDGHVVLNDVLVRYGAPLRAFAKRGTKKTELSIAIPSLISPGLIMPIPGQNVADGGTGASILVAVPPSPFGEAVIWPDIQVEGAKLVSVVKLADDIRALVIIRPEQPTVVSVMLDEQRAGQISFGGRHGVSVELSETTKRGDEQAAVEVVVKDEHGATTDLPKPIVRVKDGAELPVTRIGRGRYRSPLGSATLSSTQIIAEIQAPHVLAGAALESARAELGVKLAAPATASISEDAGGPSELVPTRFALGASLLFARSFSSLFALGGGIVGELRPPFLGGRFALRAGVAYGRMTGGGTVQYAEAKLATTIISGAWIPLDIGFSVLSFEAFELMLRAGGTLRIEQGLVRVDGDVAAGGRRVGFGAQAALDGAITLSQGALVIGATIDGIGARADGFTTEQRSIQGSLTAIRGDLGYKLWF